MPILKVRKINKRKRVHNKKEKALFKTNLYKQKQSNSISFDRL